MHKIFSITNNFISFLKFAITRKCICIVLFAGLSLVMHASTLDSIRQMTTTCEDVQDCFQSTLDFCELAANNNNKSNFVQSLPTLFLYMDSIDQNTARAVGLRTVGRGYRLLNEFSKSDSLLHLALKYSDTKYQISHTYLEWAYTKQRLGMPNECLQIVDTINNILDPNDPFFKHPSLHLVQGLCYSNTRSIAEAIKKFRKVQELSKGVAAYQAFYDRADLYLSKAFTELKSHEISLEYHQEKQENFHADGDYYRELFAYFNILNALCELGEYERALEEGHQAIRLKNEQNVFTAFGFIYVCMADAFMGLDQLDSAAYYIEKGISFSRSTNENKELADNLLGKTQLFIKQGRYKEAKPIVEEALNLRKYHDEDLLNTYAIVLENLGEHEGAYQALRTNWDHWENSESKDESRKIATVLLEERFNMEQNQQEEKFKNQMKSQKLLATIALLSLFLVMVAGYLYIQMVNTKELRRLNQSLKQHNEALEQFAYITSHDLKEPIITISGFTELLLENNSADKDGKKEKQYMSFIGKSAANLLKMIESIEKFTAVSFSKHKVEKVNLKEAIDISHQNLSQLIQKNNAVVEFYNPQAIEFVQFPKELLILIFQNLIQNGIKYNHAERPKIMVTATAKNQKTIFEIRDNGIGIDPKFHKQIFIPFKKISNTKDNQSSGLGLTICKNILENHGGDIWVESFGDGGSCFCFSI